MNIATARGENVMTDKQFDSIIEMVIQILSRASDLEDAKSALQAIKRGGSIEDSKNS
jgi:hypothetical protein